MDTNNSQPSTRLGKLRAASELVLLIVTFVAGGLAFVVPADQAGAVFAVAAVAAVFTVPLHLAGRVARRGKK